MVSMRASLALVATVLVSMKVQSQAVYYINPENVPIATRSSWCQTQITSCPLLCLQLPGESSTTAANDCNPTTLTYDCVCGNGQSPNASEYSQTLPYFICTEFGSECVASCNGDTTCQSNCRSQHPCGAQNPTRVNISTSSSTMTSTNAAGSSATTGAVVYTGLGGSAATTTAAAGAAATSTAGKSGAKAALDMGHSYGLALVLGGIFAGFSLVM